MRGSGGGNEGRRGDERGRALLNRKDFGLVDKFDGNQSKFKSWLFDLLTALGSVDQGLTKQIKELLKSRPKIVMEGGVWEPQMIWPLICLLVRVLQIISIKVNYML